MAQYSYSELIEVEVGPERAREAFRAAGTILQTMEPCQGGALTAKYVSIAPEQGTDEWHLWAEYRVPGEDGSETFLLIVTEGGGVDWSVTRKHVDGSTEAHQLIPGPRAVGGGLLHRHVHYKPVDRRGLLMSENGLQSDAPYGTFADRLVNPNAGTEAIQASVLAGDHLTPARYLTLMLVHGIDTGFPPVKESTDAAV